MAAVIESWFRQDLQKPVQVHYLDGSLFSNNGNGNRIGVELTNGGEDYTVTGTVSGYAVLADGSTVPCTGAKSGNKASILVPPAAYLPGNIFITIFLTDGTTVTTLAAVSSTVIQARTDNQVSPGSVVTDWTNTINAAMQNVETAAANLGKIVATPYAQLTFPVPLGKYTYYNNNLYRCTTPIESSEDFTAAHWSSALNLGDEVSDLKSAIDSLQEIVRLDEIVTISYNIDDTRYINYSTGAVGSSASAASFSHTGYIDVSAFQQIIYKRCCTSSATPAFGMAFYKADRTYISGEVGVGDSSLGYEESIIDVPTNAKYARFTTLNDSAQYGDFAISARNLIAEKLVEMQGFGNLWCVGTINKGYVINANGQLSGNDLYDATDYISVENIKEIYGFGYRYHFYDGSKTAISGETGIMTSCATVYNGSNLYIVSVPSDAKYFRTCALKTDIKVLLAASAYDERIVESVWQDNLWLYGKQRTEMAVKNNGGLTSNSDYNTTDYIPVSPGDVIFGYGSRYAGYDANKTFVSGVTDVLNSNDNVLPNGMHYVVIPDGVYYFRICGSKTITTPYQFKISKSNALEAYLKAAINEPIDSGRKLYCLGDSITRGMYAEQGASSSSGPTEYGYPYWIGQLNGYTVVNLGVSGSGYANQGGNNSQESGTINCKSVIDSNTFSDADIVTLAFGVNDWKGAAQDVILGDMTSTPGDGTVIGNLKYAIEKIVEKKATAQIIVLLPLNTNRKWTGMRDMTLEENWAFGYAYRNNQTLQDYRTAIRQCAEYYNVKVIDLEEVCPINRLNLRNMCGDGLHPTKAFYKQMGYALANLIC